jgi:hypothetical protein
VAGVAPAVLRHMRNKYVGFVAARMTVTAAMIGFHAAGPWVDQCGWRGLADAVVAQLTVRVEIIVHVDMRPAEGTIR